MRSLELNKNFDIGLRPVHDFDQSVPDSGVVSWQSGSPEALYQESLRDVYYLVLIYLGRFLKNLFMALSRLMEPPRALMPVLLAKYNISFLDAIGSPLRILPFEYFQSYKVLQAFIQEEFKNCPGSTWVNRGLYGLITPRYNRPLTDETWSRLIAPGATVAMAILIRGRIDRSENTDVHTCPAKRCPGTWKRPVEGSWTKCPVCQKEVFTSSQGHDQNHQHIDISVMRQSNVPHQRGNETKDVFGAPINDETESEVDEIERERFRRVLEIPDSSRRSTPKDRRTQSASARTNQYFIPKDGINREVITADICRYLGNDALVRRGNYKNPQTGQVHQGYFVTAYRNLTTAMVADLKADSERWDAELRLSSGISVRNSDSIV